MYVIQAGRRAGQPGLIYLSVFIILICRDLVWAAGNEREQRNTPAIYQILKLRDQLSRLNNGNYQPRHQIREFT